MAEKDTPDILESQSLKSPQSRRTRKKTETVTEPGQTLTGAGPDTADATADASAAPARRRRTTTTTATTARRTTTRSKKKADEEAAQAPRAVAEDGETHHHLSPAAAAGAQPGTLAAEGLDAATSFETWVRAAVEDDAESQQPRRAAAQEKPAVRRRRTRTASEDDPGIPSISLADELSAHEHRAPAAADGDAAASEQDADALDDTQDSEPGSFSSFVAQLNGKSSTAARLVRSTGKTTRTSRTTATRTGTTKTTARSSRTTKAAVADKPAAPVQVTKIRKAARNLPQPASLTTILSETDTAATSAQDVPAAQAALQEQAAVLVNSGDESVAEAAAAVAAAGQSPESTAAREPVARSGRLSPQASAAYAAGDIVQPDPVMAAVSKDEEGEEEALDSAEKTVLDEAAPAPADSAEDQDSAEEAEDAEETQENQKTQEAQPEARVLSQLRAHALRAFPSPVVTKPAQARPAPATPAEPFYLEDDGLDLMARRVSLQESKAGIEDDVTPFLAHFQYGDGRVETCIIGASDEPAVFVPADEGREYNFFRICRHVHVPEGDHQTPLPEEGFWIPPHPGPRSLQREVFVPQAPAAESQEAEAAPAHAPEPAPEEPAGRDEAVQEPAPAPVRPEHLPRILMCWVGKVDISAALRHDTVNPGPIRMLLEFVPPFDYVLLLTAMNQNVTDTLKTWLAPCIGKGKLEIRRTPVTDLSDHRLISQVATDSIDALIKQYHLPDDGAGITFHLSPGSPVTHAILLLLASIRYRGVTLMQTRLTGLGKDPDILTISLDDVLRVHGPALDELKQRMEEQAQENEHARAQSAARNSAQRSRQAGRRSVEARDLAQRFRGLHKASPSPQSQTVLQPRIQVVQTQADRASDYDLPCTVPDENSLRAPLPSIGKPGRIAPGALMPREGEPPTISAELGDVYKKMQRVATMYISILLLGESGCGKSRLARYLHEWSGRTGKFVPLDCAGLTDDMFYTELFGRGGQNVARPREGALRRARSGTLFLENVHMLTPTQQGMLVRLLAAAGETRISLPAASPYPACQCRVRVIAAAAPTLMDDVRSGRFRTDLYYRLAGVSTVLPPVREYTFEERENLLRSFLVNLQQKLGQCWNFSGDAWQTLIEEKWPGNLREVSRILQQICLLSDAETTITREDVLLQLQHSRIVELGEAADTEPVFDRMHFGVGGSLLAGSSDEDDAPQSTDELEQLRHLNVGADSDFFELGSGGSLDDTLSRMRLAKIVEAMDKTNGNRVEAARLLGLSYVQLNYTLKQLLKSRQNSPEKD